MTNVNPKDLFMDLVAQYQGRLFGYIYAMVPNVNDAQDLHQQTLMVLWRKFSQFEQGTSFMAWATKIAQFEVLRFRRSCTAPHFSLSDEVLTQVAESQLRRATDPAVESRQEQLALCIEKLTDTDRQLLDASYRRNCKIKDIASQLGRTSQSICNSLRRIRKELLRCVDRATAGEANP